MRQVLQRKHEEILLFSRSGISQDFCTKQALLFWVVGREVCSTPADLFGRSLVRFETPAFRHGPCILRSIPRNAGNERTVIETVGIIP